MYMRPLAFVLPIGGRGIESAAVGYGYLGLELCVLLPHVLPLAFVLPIGGHGVESAAAGDLGLELRVCLAVFRPLRLALEPQPWSALNSSLASVRPPSEQPSCVTWQI
jgi:hypothetical protein